MPRALRCLLVVFLVIVISFVAGNGEAAASFQVTCVPDSLHGCGVIYLSPPTLTADFFYRMPDGSNGARPNVSQDNYCNTGMDCSDPSKCIPTTITYDVRNIHDSAPDFGTLFIYKDTKASITVYANQLKTITIKPAKTYVRRIAELMCDVKNFAGEDVACQVSIDEVAQVSSIPAGAKASYVLDPGTHTVAVTLVGASAGLWAPASVTQKVTVTPGATPKKVTAAFKKAGRLIANLDQPGAVGDWYLDGVQVGTQVPTLEQWVTPNASHKIEIKNLIDPTTEGVYKWKDASVTATVSSGKEKTVTVKLKKEYLMGFLTIKCNITGDIDPAIYTGAVDCQPTIDGQVHSIILRGETAQYTLVPGQHQVSVINTLFVFLGSDAATMSQFFSPIIAAGKTTKIIYWFSFQ